MTEIEKQTINILITINIIQTLHNDNNRKTMIVTLSIADKHYNTTPHYNNLTTLH